MKIGRFILWRKYLADNVEKCYICCMKILLVDNQDSFVYNVAGLLCKCGLERKDVDVRRSDAIPHCMIGDYSGVVLSPGPGIPEESEALMSIIAETVDHMPVLGICLGHQALSQHFGAGLRHREHPLHGHSSRLLIKSQDDRLFKGICESNLTRIGRYHSWEVIAESVKCPLEVTSVADDDGAVMSVRHVEKPIFGVQFHPESIITQCGEILMRNFLELC